MPTNNSTVQKRGFFARMFGRKRPEQPQQGNRRNFPVQAVWVRCNRGSRKTGRLMLWRNLI